MKMSRLITSLSRVKHAIVGGVALATLATPAHAVNIAFAQYTQTGAGKIVDYANAGGFNTLTVTNAPVNFVTLALGPLGTQVANFNLFAASNAPVVGAVGFAKVQPTWTGSMSFTNGLTNLLTVNFTGAVFSAVANGSTGAVISSLPPFPITYSSDVLGVNASTTKDFALAMNGFAPLFSINANGLGNPFIANITGTFAAGAVPEVQSWIMLILGFGAVGAVARKRRQNVLEVLA
jgi:hypothetical protein